MSYYKVVDDEFRKNREVEIKLPTSSSKNSAGCDFYMPHDLLVEPKTWTKVIWTDVKAILEPDEVLMLYVRSSVGTKKHLMLANTVGVIDSDYSSESNKETGGNIGIMLYNYGNRPLMLEQGERIVQGVVTKYVKMNDSDNERAGGFGSSGEK